MPIAVTRERKPADKFLSLSAGIVLAALLWRYCLPARAELPPRRPFQPPRSKCRSSWWIHPGRTSRTDGRSARCPARRPTPTATSGSFIASRTVKPGVKTGPPVMEFDHGGQLHSGLGRAVGRWLHLALDRARNYRGLQRIRLDQRQRERRPDPEIHERRKIHHADRPRRAKEDQRGHDQPLEARRRFRLSQDQRNFRCRRLRQQTRHRVRCGHGRVQTHVGRVRQCSDGRSTASAGFDRRSRKSRGGGRGSDAHAGHRLRSRKTRGLRNLCRPCTA